MALADNELAVGQNHARNGEWIDITMRKINILLSMDKTDNWQTYLKYINIDLKDDLLIFKQVKIDVITFEIQNTKLSKLNHALQEQPKEERKVTESSSKDDVKENPIIPASLSYDHEMIPKSKDWVKRHNPDNKLPNLYTGRILVLESQAVIKCLKITEAPTDPESSEEILYCMKCKGDDHWTSDHNMCVASLKNSKNYKAKPYQYASPAKQILKAKAKPFPPCIHCGFNDHRPDDFRNYPECKIYGSYDHHTSRHNRVILVKLAHHTMIKSSNGYTPFSLTYETEAVIPAKISMPTIKTAKVDMVQNDEALEINLDLLEDRGEQASIHEAKSKAKMEKYYNSKARNTSFKPGDLVYWSKEVSHVKESRKLSLKWEGSYEVTKALGNC
nr:reverse transcriptase domain-containing protein [Tanacetum cinerariifolium]GEZ89522.1 reverse transcriptase domain-containing protein [Tanacetum cinerariifolium]